MSLRLRDAYPTDGACQVPLKLLIYGRVWLVSEDVKYLNGVPSFHQVTNSQIEKYVWKQI